MKIEFEEALIEPAFDEQDKLIGVQFIILIRSQDIDNLEENDLKEACKNVFEMTCAKLGTIN